MPLRPLCLDSIEIQSVFTCSNDGHLVHRINQQQPNVLENILHLHVSRNRSPSKWVSRTIPTIDTRKFDNYIGCFGCIHFYLGKFPSCHWNTIYRKWKWMAASRTAQQSVHVQYVQRWTTGRAKARNATSPFSFGEFQQSRLTSFRFIRIHHADWSQFRVLSLFAASTRRY